MTDSYFAPLHGHQGVEHLSRAEMLERILPVLLATARNLQPQFVRRAGRDELVIRQMGPNDPAA